jgi:membrane protease YdiL (CAAX protease family)
MKQNLNADRWIYTLGRVLFFCLSCVILLAVSSGLTKGLQAVWVQLISVAIAGIGAFLLTILFVRWEGLSLREIGVLPGRDTIRHLFFGLLAGSALAILQPVLLLTTGHLTLVHSPQISLTGVIINLLLYAAIACREEVAFRGYPLRSLNRTTGFWSAMGIVAIIFITEHVIGGMTWPQAIIGSGTGAILFGLAALKTKGIALPAGLHTAWNFGQWALGFKNGTGIYKAVVEKGYEARVEHIGWCSYVVVMGLGITILYFWKRNAAIASIKVTGK